MRHVPTRIGINPSHRFLGFGYCSYAAVHLLPGSVPVSQQRKKRKKSQTQGERRSWYYFWAFTGPLGGVRTVLGFGRGGLTTPEFFCLFNVPHAAWQRDARLRHVARSDARWWHVQRGDVCLGRAVAF